MLFYGYLLIEEKESIRNILEVCLINCKCRFLNISFCFDGLCRNFLHAFPR